MKKNASYFVPLRKVKLRKSQKSTIRRRKFAVNRGTDQWKGYGTLADQGRIYMTPYKPDGIPIMFGVASSTVFCSSPAFDLGKTERHKDRKRFDRHLWSTGA